MKRFLLLFCILLAFFVLPNKAASKEKTKKTRLIYVEGGEYIDYQQIFQMFALSLQELGLIENGDVPLPSKSESMEEPWQWMAKNAGGESIEFLADGFYSGKYNKKQNLANIEAIKERIDKRNDIDVILSFGTRASRELVTLDIQVPVIVVSTTDPVGANIVRSETDSGKENIVAIIHDRQHGITIFHDIFKFKKLGIAYENTTNGRDVIGLATIEKAAAAKGIELLRCHLHDINLGNPKTSSKQIGACHKKLVQEGAEAIFLSTTVSLTPKNANEILSPIHKKRLPTFSQVGSSDVKYGALMSISENNFSDEGAYLATLLTQIMAGAKPNSLQQILHSNVHLAINLRTAASIGWNPTLEVLATADEFYY